MRGAVSYGQGGQRLGVAQGTLFFAHVDTHHLGSTYSAAAGHSGEEDLSVWTLVGLSTSVVSHASMQQRSTPGRVLM